jgi:hypothetical protein
MSARNFVFLLLTIAPILFADAKTYRHPLRRDRRRQFHDRSSFMTGFQAALARGSALSIGAEALRPLRL